MTDTAKASRRAFLVGLREDGSPTCHPMVAIERDGAPAFNTYRKSAKARNFLRDPRAAAMLLNDWQAPPSTAQMVTGIMEEVDLPAPDIPAERGALDVPETVSDRAQRRVAEGKRMVFRLRPAD